MPPARSATCGAKSPAISVAADQQRNFPAHRIVEIPLFSLIALERGISLLKRVAF
jgi:hypothetical protein